MATATKPPSPTPSKTLPHNLDAERAVLGSMLLDEHASIVALERLRAEHFFHPPHRLIFDTLRSLSATMGTATLTTLAEALDRQNVLEQVGGVYYLGDIAQSVTTSTQIESYVEIVRHRALLRRLIHVSAEITDRALNSGEDSQKILAWSEQQIFDIGIGEDSHGFQAIGDYIDPIIRKVMAAFEKQGGLTGVPSGFRDLDEKTNGFQKSDLVIVAARPGVGKTSIALNIAENAASRGKTVAFFSLEMAAQQLVERVLCARARVNLKHLRDGFLRRQEGSELMRVAGELSSYPLHIDDTTYLTPSDIASRIRHLMTRVPDLSLVIIDYLQLMHGDRKRESRQVEVSDISRSLKLMARDFKIPIMALAQLSRAAETRSDGGGGRKVTGAPRPKLSDLRESGAIEQDADIVIFLHRDVKKDENDVEGVAENIQNSVCFDYELVLEKHRNGPTGIVKVEFQSQFTRFNSVSHRPFEDPYAVPDEAPPEGADDDAPPPF